VQISLEMIAGYAAAASLEPPRALALGHCVLAHHGADAAPAGRFQSVEALALYRLNALDAGVKGRSSTARPALAPRGAYSLNAPRATITAWPATSTRSIRSRSPVARA